MAIRGRPRGSKNRPREQHSAEVVSIAARSNGAERAKIIREVCRDLATLDAERKAIGAQMREIQQKRIKGDLGMKIADFNAARRLAALEDDNRDTYIDAVRETFAALGVGEQGSFMSAFEQPAAAPAAREPRATTPSERGDAMEQARQHLYGDDDDEGDDEPIPPDDDDAGDAEGDDYRPTAA